MFFGRAPTRVASAARRAVNSDAAKPIVLQTQRQMRLLAAGAILAAGSAAAYYYYRNSSRRRFTLDPAAFRDVILAGREDVSPETAVFSFHGDFANIPEYPSFVYVLNDQCYVARAYTPLPVAPGGETLKLLVRHYADGVMTPHLWKLRPGDSIKMRGPLPALEYAPNTVRSLGLVAGGTGIAPVLSLVRHICSNKDDMTQVTLVYASRDVGSVHLKSQIDDLQRKYAGQFKVVYTVDEKKNGNGNGNGNENGNEGRDDKNLLEGKITKDVLAQYLPRPSKDHSTGVMVCGSDGFVSYIAGPKKSDNDPGPLGGLLKEMGYAQYDVHKF